jgi:DNA-binding MarR family transcriptional regulator
MNNQQISRLQRVIKVFKDVYPDMNANMMLVLLEVAKNQGITGQDIVNKHDIPQAVASRALRFLDAGPDPLREWGLCDMRIDPTDQRNRLRYPNAKMTKLLARLEEALD